MEKFINRNQDPDYYTRDYYLRSCAGHESYVPGTSSKHPIFTYLIEIAGPMVSKKILDVGCGRGELVLAAAQLGAKKIVGIDFSKDALELAQENIQHSEDIDSSRITFVQENILKFQPDTDFDIIFIADVIEHLHPPELHQLFNHLIPMLAPNGFIVLHTMPTREFMNFGQYIKKFLLLIRGKNYIPLTYESQYELTHVNLQSRKTLREYITPYPNRLWYDFAHKNFLKKIISKTFLVRYLSSNLWGVVKRDN